MLLAPAYLRQVPVLHRRPDLHLRRQPGRADRSPRGRIVRLTTRDGRQVGAYGQLGTFSEYTLVQQIRVMRYERDIPAQVAAVTSCGVITGYGSAVRAAGIRDGDTVVVVGTGGVGMSAVMGAAIAGAAQIVAVDPVAFKREQALKLGATHAAPSVEAAQALVSDLTRNRMADSAIITVGVLHGDLIGPVSAWWARAATSS